MVSDGTRAFGCRGALWHFLSRIGRSAGLLWQTDMTQLPLPFDSPSPIRIGPARAHRRGPPMIWQDTPDCEQAIESARGSFRKRTGKWPHTDAQLMGELRDAGWEFSDRSFHRWKAR